MGHEVRRPVDCASAALARALAATLDRAECAIVLGD